MSWNVIVLYIYIYIYIYTITTTLKLYYYLSKAGVKYWNFDKTFISQISSIRYKSIDS